MAFPQTPLMVGIEILVDGAWMDITADVYLSGKIQITWGRQDWASKANTTKCPLILNNGRSRVNPLIVGRYSRRNPRSDLYRRIGRNTRLRITVITLDGVSTRFDGFVSSWPTKWGVDAVSGAQEMDVWVSIQANGIRRRLEQGSQSGPDAIRRYVARSSPLLYWPLTDGEDARQGSEIIQGAQPLRSIGSAGSFYQGQPAWGKGSLAPWLEPVVELPDSTEGLLTAYIPPVVLTSWSFEYAIAIPGVENLGTMKLTDTGARTDPDPQTEWQVITLASTNLVQVLVTDRGETSSSTAVLASDLTTTVFDGGVHHLRLTVIRNGSGECDWSLYLDGALLLSGTRATPHRPLSRVTLEWITDFGTAPDAVAVGHLTYWGPNPPTAADTWRAVQGYSRELAGRRIERLCAEQGVALAVTGNLDQTPQMGPQKPGTFLSLIDSAADVDGGVVHESRDGAGFAYRTRTSKYNQGV